MNYGPGPCDTDMQRAVRETTGHAPTHEYFTNLHKEVCGRGRMIRGREPRGECEGEGDRR